MKSALPYNQGSKAKKVAAYSVRAAVIAPMEEFPDARLVLEKVRFRNSRKPAAFRLGYFTVHKRQKVGGKARWKKGRKIWSQFFPQEDLLTLIDFVRKDKGFLKS